MLQVQEDPKYKQSTVVRSFNQTGGMLRHNQRRALTGFFLGGTVSLHAVSNLREQEKSVCLCPY
jgi:hypothetical protein